MYKKIEFRPFINGEFIKPNCKKIRKISPSCDKKIPDIFDCNKEIVENAINYANNIFLNGKWKNLENDKKKKIFHRVKNKIKKNIHWLSYLDSLETGRAIKNLKEDSIPKALKIIEYFLESFDKIYEKMIPIKENELGFITREPLGVTAIITSFNDPLVPALWKICPALLSGNSVIFKPSEFSTYSILEIAKYFKESGLPNGTLNILTGAANTCKHLIYSNKIHGIYFTGSSSTGRKIFKTASKNSFKKIFLECGGKSSMVISERSKNLKYYSKILAKNIFYNQGQTCSAPSRLIIHKKILENFLQNLYKEIPKYIPKNPLDLKSNVGGLVSKKAYDIVKKAVLKADKMNLKKIVFKEKMWNKKFAYPPTVFLDISPKNFLFKNEIFGPILTITTFNNFKDAIKLSNNSNYGLASCIISDSFDEIREFINKSECGMVHINSYGQDTNQIPFGGFKNSGLGFDKSQLSFDNYTKIKSIYFRGT